ncbi:MAG: hypothetical protein KJZ54_13735 [Phycisphaerales bacterium]|nr:hypothetical protein [Phycisphaerales bacterium]
MGTARMHFAIAWVALVAQVIAAALGPSGLLLCREADGSTHYEWAGYEWAGEGCCFDDNEPGAISNVVPSAGLGSQACIGCTDQPAGQIPAVGTHRPTVGSDYLAQFLALPLTGGLAGSHLELAPSGRPVVLPTGEGPPTQVLRALRATVLIL